VIHQDAGHPRADPGGDQVDVDGSQASDFAAPHAGGGEQYPDGEQAVAADVLDEGAQLGGHPNGSLGDLAGRWVGRAGDVAHDQSPAHCQ
jgi:hypothetical protein